MDIFLMIILLVIVIIIPLIVWIYKNRQPTKDYETPKKSSARLPKKVLKVEDLLRALSKSIKRISKYQQEISKINEHIEALLDTCNSPLLVTVIGEFSSGKSTFINSLIKEKLLAMKDVETTASITILKYGHKKKVCVKFKDGSEKETDPNNIVSDLDKYSVENFEEESDLDKIKLVSISLQNELLKHIDIADTPGYGSDLNRHTENTKNFTKYSDAIIWIFNAQQFGKASEISTLAENCKHFKPIAIVNKIDQTPLKNGESYETKFAPKIAKLNGLVERIFFISAFKALEGMNGSYPRESGMQDIIDYFNSEIIPKANQKKAESIINKVIGIGEDLVTIYNKLASEISEKNLIINEFNTEVTKVENDISEINKILKIWNKDIDSRDIIYLLDNHRNYFLRNKVPQNISDRVLQYQKEYANLLKDNDKINKWKSKLDDWIIQLDNEYSVWYSAWQKYSEKGFGLKRWIDDMGLYETKERKMLNDKANIYDKHQDAYNEDVKKYNKFLEDTNRKIDGWNDSCVYFINNTILGEIKKTKSEIDYSQELIKNKRNLIKGVQSELKKDLKNIEIFENEIKNTFAMIPSLAINGMNAASVSSIKDFKSIIVHINSFKKTEAVDWERIYTINRIENLNLKDVGVKNKKLGLGNKELNKDLRKTKQV